MDTKAAWNLLVPKELSALEKAELLLLGDDTIMKAALHKERLVKKIITDKTGKKTTKWVRPDQAVSEKVKKIKETPAKKSTKSVDDHARETNTADLKSYLKLDKPDDKVKSSVVKELSRRGEKVPSDSSIQQETDRLPESQKSGKKVEKNPVSVSTEKKPKEKAWYDNIASEYNLDRLPVGLKQEEVVFDPENGNDGWVMKWKDPKTNKTTFSYTREFLAKNAQEKWKRVQNIDPKNVTQARATALKMLENPDEKIAEASAVIYIMATTGLRVGNKVLFKQSGNRGVSTLSPDNVEIDGDFISFNFVGKSYKENTAQIHSKKLADYLTKLKEERKGKEFLFDVGREKLVSVFRDDMGFKGFKLKDIRTTVATEIAKNILYTDPMPPLPLPKGEKDVKKMIQAKLKHVFDVVSQHLNNTPAMAKNSYIVPQVIDAWISDLGVSMKEIEKGEESVMLEEPTLQQIQLDITDKESNDLPDYDDDKEMGEDLDIYPLPSWWDDSLDSDTPEKIEKAEKDKVEDYEYKKYMKKSLGKKREQMPQIDPDDVESYLSHFRNKYKVTKIVKKISELKPSQDDINDGKLLKFIKNEADWKKREYIISKDGYLIDGHHSWAQGLEFDPDHEVDVYQIGLPIKRLLSISNMMKITKKKDINDKIVKAEGLKKHKTVEEIAKLHKVDKSVIFKQLAIGVKIEKEHTTDTKIAKTIALQHIEEFVYYYTNLLDMEKEMKEEDKVIEKGGKGGHLVKIRKIVERGGKKFLGTYWVDPSTMSNVKKEGEEIELTKVKDKFRVGEIVVFYHSKLGKLSGEITNMSHSATDKYGAASVKVGGKSYNVSLLKLKKAGIEPEKKKNTINFPESIDDLVLYKGLGGSSGVKLVGYGDINFALKTARDRDTGEAQLKEEMLATDIYRLMGANVPDMKLIDSKHLVSEFIEGKELGKLDLDEEKGVIKKLQKHFVLDAFLGNWDVVGDAVDNIIVTPDGFPYRIDNGGALRYRARGGEKGSAFGSEVTEIDSMRDPSKPAGLMFNDISDEEIRRQVEELKSKAGEIFKLVPPELDKILGDRLAWLNEKYGSGAVKPESKPTEPKKEEDLKGYGSAVTRDYFKDWDTFEFNANPEMKGTLKKRIMDFEYVWNNDYMRYAKDHGMTIEEYKQKLQQLTEKICAESQPFRATNLTALKGILGKDGRYKTQFETGIKSEGTYDPEFRALTEYRFFGFKNDVKHDIEKRPVYTYWSNNGNGVQTKHGENPPSNEASQYGVITVKFKPHVRNQTTITMWDSLGSSSYMMAVPLNKPHFTLLGTGGDPLNDYKDYSSSKLSGYNECQIHGGVKLEDIESFHLSTNNMSRDKAYGMEQMNEFLKVYTAAAARGKMKEIGHLPDLVIYDSR